MRRKNKKGFISFVGAGPGDPKLLTIRASEALRAADVVVYDHLIHPAVVAWAPQARHLYAGKIGGDPHSTSQKKIESLLVRLASKGARVVRLKGGDPFIFGRGGQEALAAARRGIPFEIIPGITAGAAAPAYAGVPLTHRGLASQVTFLTAHEDPAKKQGGIDWKEAARLNGTLVLYMGVRTLSRTARALIQYGKDAGTPVSVIQWGTLPAQTVVTGVLGTIAREVKRSKLGAPAVMVIGEVNRLRKKLGWFEQKPLFGKKVLVTRPRGQAPKLTQALERTGALVLELPTVEIAPIQDYHALDRAVRRIRLYDWVVFTSENGVAAFFGRLKALRKDARVFSNARTQIAAIGPGTEARLAEHAILADLVPAAFSSEGLVNAFRKIRVQGKRFLLLRTDIAPKFLNESLAGMGARVEEVAVYRTARPRGLNRKAADLIRRHRPDYVTFTSASTARHFFEVFRNGHSVRAKVVSIGPETSKAIRAMGGNVNREARIHDIPGLVEAVLEEERHGVS